MSAAAEDGIPGGSREAMSLSQELAVTRFAVLVDDQPLFLCCFDYT